MQFLFWEAFALLHCSDYICIVSLGFCLLSYRRHTFLAVPYSRNIFLGADGTSAPLTFEVSTLSLEVLGAALAF